MAHLSDHALFGVLLIAYGAASLVAAKPGSSRGGYWVPPESEQPVLQIFLFELQGLLVALAGVALAFGWQAFGLAEFLPF